MTHQEQNTDKPNLHSRRKILPVLCFLFLFTHLLKGQLCPVPGAVNLIPNGNFESCVIGTLANDGFNTDYNYSGLTTCPGGENNATISTYTVTTSASTLNGAYSNPTGTPGIGNPTPNKYLLVDVDGDITKAVYKTSVNVVAGTTYFFSAWMADIHNTFTNPPILQFFINGSQVGSTVHVDAAANTHDWQQFYVLWTAPTTATVNISISNERPTSQGNDLALDNISFTSSCTFIQNTGLVGKTSNLIDTIYACNVSFPYTLNPQLGAGYNLRWKNSGGTTIGTAGTYTFATAPVAGKYYLCYDTIAGCPRADSVYVSNTLKVNIKPDQILCAPVNYTINPGLTGTGINYEWRLNGTIVTSSTAAITYQATQVGTYTLTVTKSGCGSSTSQMTITSPSTILQGTAICSGGNYQFNATAGTYNTINGISKVAWYNVPSGGSPINATGTSATVSSAASLASAPGCSPGGLYAEDLNSFNTTLIPSNPPCATTSIMGANAGAIELIVYSNVTLNSLKIMQKNYSTGGNANYAVEIRSNNPGGGPYSGGCNCNTDGPGALITGATGPTLTVPLTTTSTVQTLPVGPSGNGYTLTGTPAGTKYWITVTGSEFEYFNCGATYPIQNTPNPGVVQINRQLVYNGESTQMEAFNLQLTVGTPSQCSRTWVCASNCGLPVTFIAVNGINDNDENIVSWTTGTEINSHFFVVERSLDGINFSSIGIIQANGSGSTYFFRDEQVTETAYYRLKQVDLDGTENVSGIITVSHAETAFQVYPNPNEGTFYIKVEGKDRIGDLEIINLEGRSVYTVSRENISEECKIDGLTKGVYYIQLKLDNRILRQKLCVY